MHTQRLCALSGALLGMLMTGVALVAMGETIHGDLWITLALFTLAWLVVLSTAVPHPVAAGRCGGGGGPAAAAVLVAGPTLPHLWAVWQPATSAVRTAGVQVWVGCYLGVLLAGAVLLLSVLVPWRRQGRAAASR